MARRKDAPPAEARALIRLRISPGAKRSEVSGEYGEAVKVKIAAPPVDGKANEALLEFLSEALGAPRRQISLISGECSRDKVVQVEGMGSDTARAALLARVR